MGTWNHRIVMVKDENGADVFGVYEVHYDDAGKPIARTVEPATFVGDTWREVADEVARINISKPVLTDAQIGGES